MAVFNNDREKRKKGDNLVAKEKKFESVSPEVFAFFGVFCTVHVAFKAALEERERERAEDIEARVERDKIVKLAIKVYTWAWYYPTLTAKQSWMGEVDKEFVNKTRSILFPLGPPKNIHSTQMAVDGIRHFNASKHRVDITYPADFLQDALNIEEQLVNVVNDVAIEEGETRDVSDKHKESRVKWDKYYRSLKEITSAFLRVQDRLSELKIIFSSPAKAKKDELASKEVVSSEGAHVTTPQTSTED